MTATMTRMYSDLYTMSATQNDSFFDFWRHELEKMGSEQILHWAFDSYGPRLGLVTAFEPEGCVLLTMLSKITSNISVLCNAVDFQMQHLWEISKQFSIKRDIKIHPEIVTPHSPIECLFDRSAWEPAIDRFDALIFGGRRQEDPETKILSRHPVSNIPIIAPLARWTKAAVMNKLNRDAVVHASYRSLWEHVAKAR